MDVYIDLYFLINAGMDLLCLTMTAMILHRPAKRWRLMLAASLGGAYAVLALLCTLGGALSVLLDLCAAILLAAVALSERGGRVARLFQNAGVYALLSALLGGLMTVLYRFLNRLDLPLESLHGDGLSAWMLVILATVAGAITLRGAKLFRRSAAMRSVWLEITVGERCVRLHALVDSGNLLTDPLSGRSVALAEPEKLRPILPPGLWQALTHPTVAKAEDARRVRLIPARGATGSGLLTAFAPDRLVICNGQERMATDDLIALAPLKGAANGFDALIALE